jgi:DNA-binding beta-propeller fold protein YncE
VKYRKTLVIFVLSLLFFSVISISANANETYVFETKWGAVNGSGAPERGSGDSEFNSPNDIAVDSSGNFYVADAGNFRFQKFDSNGTFILKRGSRGEGDGQFKSVSGIAVDSSGNIYVADGLNNRIQKFDSSGNFLGWFGKDNSGHSGWHAPGSGRTGASGSGNGELNVPGDLAVDSHGNIYVVDIDNYRIQKFAPDGSFLLAWGHRGMNVGEFYSPSGIAIDPSGNVFVSDYIQSSIQKFNSTGVFQPPRWEAAGGILFYLPRALAIDLNGNVYVVEIGAYQRVQKFNSSGRPLSKWGRSGNGNGQFHNPSGIAVSPSGNIVYVADYGNNRIQKFSMMLAAAAVMSTATLPPQYIISVHEGGNSEGILQIVHDDNSEGLISKMSAVVPAPGAALGAPIEDARVRVGGDPFITTDSNGRTPAFVAKKGDSISIAKRGYKTLRITIPTKKYADRFSGIVVQLKRQLGPAAPISVPAPSIRTPVGP